MVVRMWEARAVPGRLEGLLDWVFDVALAGVARRNGFERAEVFRSDEQDRVVVNTYWRGESSDLPEPPEELAARPAYSWDFEPVTR